ncbi:MAG TPA: hypothetical protein VMR62_10460 [Bryobacteraceae bacterium]|jgi:hypothetical protein|nr:hypothetical protein [Bryobacteraceae bacterium]
MPTIGARSLSCRFNARTAAALCALLAITVALCPLAAQTQTIVCNTPGNPCWSTGGFDNHRDSHNNNETKLLDSTVCANGAPATLSSAADARSGETAP